MFMIKHF